MNDAVILVTRQGLGTTAPGDADFGLEMLDKFFHTLESQRNRPRAICFYTEGVKLLVNDSPVILGLRLLEGLGVRLVACQSCLQRYGLRDQIALGEVGGMPDIVQLMQQADKVITI